MYLVILEKEERILERGRGLDRELYYATHYVAPVLFSDYELAKAYANQDTEYEIFDLEVVDIIYIVERKKGNVRAVFTSEKEVKEYMRTKKADLYTITIMEGRG